MYLSAKLALSKYNVLTFQDISIFSTGFSSIKFHFPKSMVIKKSGEYFFYKKFCLETAS